jgi:hypothetical protein
MEAGRRHGAEVAEVNAYYLDSPLGACLERNRLRTGKARVPDVGLFATAKMLRAPAFSEGFDRIFAVRFGEGFSEEGGFEVREL